MNNEISPADIDKTLLLPNTILIDVRDEWEFDEFNIGGLNIPMPAIREKRHLLDSYTNIVIVCTNGIRSKIAMKDYCRAEALKDKHFYHVKGGLLGFE
jgi:rhodanese-related sulfurtransferase